MLAIPNYNYTKYESHTDVTVKILIYYLQYTVIQHIQSTIHYSTPILLRQCYNRCNNNKELKFINNDSSLTRHQRRSEQNQADDWTVLRWHGLKSDLTNERQIVEIPQDWPVDVDFTQNDVRRKVDSRVQLIRWSPRNSKRHLPLIGDDWSFKFGDYQKTQSFRIKLTIISQLQTAASSTNTAQNVEEIVLHETNVCLNWHQHVE